MSKQQKLNSWSPWLVALGFALGLVATQMAFNEFAGMGVWRTRRPLLTVPGTALLLAAPLVFLSRARAIAYTALMVLLLNTLAWGDLLYARQFHASLSARLLSQVGNLQGLGPSIFGLSRWEDLLFPLFAFATIAWVTKMAPTRQADREFSKIFSRQKWKAFATLVLLGLALHTTIYLKNAIVYKRNPFLLSFDSIENTAVFTLPFYHILDALDSTLSNDKITLTPQEQSQNEAWFSEHHRLSTLPPLVPFGIAQGKNLLLIQWEALELSIFNLRVGEEEVAPNLNKFLRDSLFFSRFHTQVGHGNTSDAELATQTSLYPLPKASAFFRLGDNRYNGMPHVLGSHGYTSLAFHGNAGSFWNRGLVWPNMGFETFFDKRRIVESATFKTRIIGMGIDDFDTFHFVTDIITATPSPWYAFVVTLTSHTPFQISRDIAPFPKAAPADMPGDYLRAIHYADKAFGEFMSGLEKKGVLRDTVVALYGDHEAIVGDVRAQAVADGFAAFGVNASRVPFAIHLPKSLAVSPQNIAIWGAQVDVFPTLAHLLGVPPKEIATTTLGQNLFVTSRGGAIHPFGQWFGGENEPHFQEAVRVSERLLRSCHTQQRCGLSSESSP